MMERMQALLSRHNVYYECYSSISEEVQDTEPGNTKDKVRLKDRNIRKSKKLDTMNKCDVTCS